MPEFKVGHDYQSSYRGRRLGYSEGDVTEVDETVAAWVNRDSPGTLVPVDEDPPTEPEDSSKGEDPDSSEDASGHVCDDCGFEAKSDFGLQSHRRTHGGDG